MALGGDIPFALMLNGSAVTKASYRMIVRNCLNGVIRGIHIRQAEEFCKNDMVNMKMEHVVAIREIDDYEAHQFFDMDEEERYPIFK